MEQAPAICAHFRRQNERLLCAKDFHNVPEDPHQAARLQKPVALKTSSVDWVFSFFFKKFQWTFIIVSHARDLGGFHFVVKHEPERFFFFLLLHSIANIYEKPQNSQEKRCREATSNMNLFFLLFCFYIKDWFSHCDETIKDKKAPEKISKDFSPPLTQVKKRLQMFFFFGFELIFKANVLRNATRHFFLLFITNQKSVKLFFVFVSISWVIFFVSVCQKSFWVFSSLRLKERTKT